MPFTVPKVAIGDLTTWHNLEPVDVALENGVALGGEDA